MAITTCNLSLCELNYIAISTYYLSGGSRIWWKGGGVNKGEVIVRGTKWRERGVGQGGGIPPPHYLEENGNQEMPRGLLKHTKICIL